MKTAIYLDNAATTRMDPRVVAAMSGAEESAYGNASAVHGAGVCAAKAVERTRASLAAMLNADSDELIFTSGGTESNNMALLSFPRRKASGKLRLAVSSVEHSSVLEPARRLERKGACLVLLPVDAAGFVLLPALEKELKRGLDFVSVMQANNETGVLQPLEEIGRLCRRHGALFHADACQGFGKNPLDVRRMRLDMLTLSAHKIHGPKGVGALFVREGLRLQPLMFGGGQERGLRSGTLNAPGIAGFGVAAALCSERENQAISALRDFFAEEALRLIPGSSLNGDPERRLCGNINLRFDGVDGSVIVRILSARGIYVSAGATCSAGKSGPSHVLLAMGQDMAAAASAVRISLGRFNTAAEVRVVLRELEKSVAEARGLRCRR